MVTNRQELLHLRGDGPDLAPPRLLLLGVGRRAGRGLHLPPDWPSCGRLHGSSYRRGPCPSAAACFGTSLDGMEKAPLASFLCVFEYVTASVWWVFEVVVCAPCDGDQLAVLSGA